VTIKLYYLRYNVFKLWVDLRRLGRKFIIVQLILKERGEHRWDGRAGKGRVGEGRVS